MPGEALCIFGKHWCNGFGEIEEIISSFWLLECVDLFGKVWW